MKSQLEGDYRCGFCRNPFRQKRYSLDDGEIYFCLPDCLVAYHLHIVGGAGLGKHDYTKLCGREVVPAPLGTYLDEISRETWLKERYDGISEKDKAIAQQELFVSRQ